MMHRVVLLTVCISVSALSMSAFAVIETYEFSSPTLESRYHQLSQELRCPKCQNQNIADSNAPISKDLRQLVYQQLEAGASDEQIRADLVARYGEFVRYRPAQEGVTLLLWLFPIALLALGLFFVAAVVRSGRRDDQQPVTRGDLDRLTKVLDDESTNS